VLIEFEDSGPGMAPEIIEKVFDPYFSTKSGGHGLGLATSFSIIQKHGGTIKAGNGVNGGALFTLLIPASRDSGEQLSSASDTEVPLHSGRILVLDDDRIVLETACTMLRKLGYSCDTAEDGAAAVRMYREAFEHGKGYKAVIMDLTIPGGFGGAQVVQKVLETDPEAVVIVSSGYAGNDVMANYESYGFRGVLAKPYTMSELSDSLLRAMGN